MMKRFGVAIFAVLLLLAGLACSNNKNKETSSTENGGQGAATQSAQANQDVAKVNDDNIKDQLKAANLNDVDVKVSDNNKTVTLGGSTATAEQKNQAEEIAKQHAAGYVVANEIGVRPEGDNKRASKKVDSNVDDAIKSNWKALSAQNHWDDQHISSDVNNGVLTLKGDVDNQSQRSTIERAAAKIPNVKQVVNELAVKDAGK